MRVWGKIGRSEQTEQSWEPLYKHMLISMCVCVHPCEYLYELSSMRMGRAVRDQKGELSKRKELN